MDFCNFINNMVLNNLIPLQIIHNFIFRVTKQSYSTEYYYCISIQVIYVCYNLCFNNFNPKILVDMFATSNNLYSDTIALITNDVNI